jgi:lysozyme
VPSFRLPQRLLSQALWGRLRWHLLDGLTQWEGKKNVGYFDIVGIPTACMGDTNNVVVGKFYSDTECRARLEQQAIIHISEVKQ